MRISDNIFLSQAQTLEVNPLYLTLSTTIATSFAFMFPMATPPNAIVFAYGHLKVIDMVRKLTAQVVFFQ